MSKMAYPQPLLQYSECGNPMLRWQSLKISSDLSTWMQKQQESGPAYWTDMYFQLHFMFPPEAAKHLVWAKPLGVF